MVDTVSLAPFRDSMGVVTEPMEPKEWERRPEQDLAIARDAQLESVGWRSRQNSSRSPAEGEVFFLTSLFIEQVTSGLEYPIGTEFLRALFEGQISRSVGPASAFAKSSLAACGAASLRSTPSSLADLNGIEESSATASA
jgi:hypothetical protein